jgi:cytoskeletal protein RodZ
MERRVAPVAASPNHAVAPAAQPLPDIDELPPMSEQAEDSFEDAAVPSDRRRSSPAARWTVALLVAFVGVLGAFGAIRAMQARQERLADDDRARADIAAASAHVRSVAVPPVAPSAQSPPSASTTAAPTETTNEVPATTSGTTPPASATPAPNGGAPTPTLPATAVRPGPALPSSPAQEAPLDTSAESGKDSLVAQASHALSRGATARAVELSRQAVAANPSNADAWLTLGAAYQASGNLGAAKDAYRSCVSQAHSANVSECRVLSGP